MKNWRLGTSQNNSFWCISKASKDSDLTAFENCQSQPMYFINRSSMVTLKHSPRRRQQKQRGVIGQVLPEKKAVRKKKAQRQVGGRTQFSSGKHQKQRSTKVSSHCFPVCEMGTEVSACDTRLGDQRWVTTLALDRFSSRQPTIYGSLVCCVVIHSRS